VNHPCPRYEPELSAYLDGELTASQRTEIDTHLRACEPCQAALAQLRGVSRTLRRWDAQETRYATSSGFRNRVFTKVGADAHREHAGISRFPWRAAAAAALVAAGAGAYALVAPKSSDDAEVARLRGEMQDLRQMVAAQSARPTQQPQPSPAGAAETPAIERVSPLGTLVAPPSPEELVAAPPAPQEVWEQDGERKYVRDSLPGHNDFVRERFALALEEAFRAMTAQAARPAERPTSAAAALPPLAQFIQAMHVAPENYPAFNRVQVWPIVAPAGYAAAPRDRVRAVSCKEALQQAMLTVTEDSANGTVVAVNKDLKRSVLVLAGDVFLGPRQDRVARVDVLLGPGDTLSIPTYTSGRERRKTSYHNFTQSNGIAPPALRALIAADRALWVDGLDQERFDDAVEGTVTALASTRGSGSLDNLFGNPELVGDADHLGRNFEKRLDDPSVVGFAVSAGSELLGIEVFGDHAALMDHRAALLRSYMMAAFVPDRLEGAPPSRDVVAGLLAAAPAGAFRGDTTSGANALSVFRGIDGGSFGFGLLDGQRVVHMALFAAVPAIPGAGEKHGAGHRGSTDAPALDSGRDGAGATRGDNPSSGVDPSGK
jgi:hypothetical protein